MYSKQLVRQLVQFLLWIEQLEIQKVSKLKLKQQVDSMDLIHLQEWEEVQVEGEEWIYKDLKPWEEEEESDIAIKLY